MAMPGWLKTSCECHDGHDPVATPEPSNRFPTMLLRAAPGITALLFSVAVIPHHLAAQTAGDPKVTEVWTPVPKIIAPGATAADAPSDAIVLFDGKSVGAWVNAKDKSPANWTVANGVMTVNKAAGDIMTKQSFRDYQLHLEWRIPPGLEKFVGQERGNSGLYLASTGTDGYELQILDSYNNTTYVNGQAGSIYKQSIPLANAMRKQGDWQTYDVVWTAPRFKADGSLDTPAYVTALHNGVLVQDHVAIKGFTRYIGAPSYTAHGALPILLQAHGDPSPPISFRNIWVRELGSR